jgi:membrane protease YdiL (CAAX protease family)
VPLTTNNIRLTPDIPPLNKWTKANIIVLGGICAPIAEELTVRGLLMGYIEKKANITFAIIVISK